MGGRRVETCFRDGQWQTHMVSFELDTWFVHESEDRAIGVGKVFAQTWRTELVVHDRDGLEVDRIDYCGSGPGVRQHKRLRSGTGPRLSGLLRRGAATSTASAH